MIHTTKKKLQLLFKKFSYELFKLFYAEVNKFEKVENNRNSKITISKINNDYNYKVFTIDNVRMYTDTINDCAVIQNNKVLIGPSYQIRDTKFEKIENNIVFTKGTPRLKKKLKGKVLSLLTGGAGNFNYWHWLFDVLPRINIVKNILSIDKIDYFLFPNVKKKFQRETINFLKIPIKKSLSSLEFRHIECDQLITTEHPYVIKNNATEEIQNLPQWIIEWLQVNFMKKMQLDDPKFPKKIYIDRTDASPNVIQRRKIINNSEVKKIVSSNGYKILNLSDHSFQDQIKYFYNADKVTGLHGAGFANVIFSKPGTSFLELKPHTAGKACENLAKKCELNYDCISVIPKKNNENNQMGSITININELEKKL